MVEVKRVVNNTYVSTYLENVFFSGFFLTVKFYLSSLNKEAKNIQNANVVRWEKVFSMSSLLYIITSSSNDVHQKRPYDLRL